MTGQTRPSGASRRSATPAGPPPGSSAVTKVALGSILTVDAARWRRDVAPRRAPRPTVFLAPSGEPSEPAVSVAVQLALGLDAPVAVASVAVRDTGCRPPADGAHLLDELRHHGVEVVRIAGARGRSPVRAVWEARAQLIVVAFDSRPGLAGLSARRLLRDLLATGLPVLCVPPRLGRDWGLHRMLRRTVVLGAATGPAARRAGAWAATLARRSSGQVTVVRVCAPSQLARAFIDAASPWATEAWTTAAEEFEEACRRQLDAWVAGLRRAGADARAQLLRGPVAEEIAAAARQSGAGLVIVGGGGWHRRTFLLRSSVGERVLRAGSLPVMLVP